MQPVWIHPRLRTKLCHACWFEWVSQTPCLVVTWCAEERYLARRRAEVGDIVVTSGGDGSAANTACPHRVADDEPKIAFLNYDLDFLFAESRVDGPSSNSAHEIQGDLFQYLIVKFENSIEPLSCRSQIRFIYIPTKSPI